MVLKWCAVAVVCGLTTAANGQEFERDYSKYLRPVVFVLPIAPAPSESQPSLRKYRVRIDILPTGRVELPVAVDPPEPLMTDAVNDAARLWLFAPGLNEDCKTSRRSGRVNLEYDTVGGRAWLEVPDIVNKSAAYSFDIIHEDPINFPRYKPQQDITTGVITVASKIMADGTASEASVFIAIPPNRGFMDAARRHALATVVQFKTPIDKPFICTLRTYTFKYE